MVRHGGFLAAFVTIAVAAVTIPAASAAEVVTVCGGGTSSSRDALAASPALRPLVTLAYVAPRQVSPTNQLALLSDGSSYDIVLNWNADGQTSLRASGAEILAASIGPGLVHVMVQGGAASCEQYLFSLGDDGAGELLWGREDIEPSAAALNRASCTAPRR